MKDNWTKDIHDKMARMEMDEPLGLWDDICAARKEAEIVPLAPRKQTSPWLWVRRVSSVAAMAALLLGTGLYLFQVNDKSNISPSNNQYALASAASPAPVSASADDMLIEAASSSMAATGAASAQRPAYTAYQEEKPMTAAASASATEATHSETSVNNRTENSQPSEPKDKTPSDDSKLKSLDAYDPFEGNLLASASKPRSATSRLSLGIYSNGATGYNSNTRYTSAPVLASAGPNDGASWEGSPLLGILLLNSGTNCEYELKHHLPIRTGVTASYAIGKHLSIESGITFTSLVSDMRDGNALNFQKGIQKLRYIGIPVNIGYQFFSWNRLGIYASAGFLAEQCISATQKIEYHIDNRTVKQEKNDVGSRPFQASVNGAVGIQYNLSPMLELYAGPGISYHFDDGSSLKTIYKDKALNFNLNLGVRLRLNNL